jgi:hypothetical protein
MERVILLKCSRCELRWVEEPDQKKCPRCQKYHRKSAVVAGVEVEVKRTEVFGGDDGLQDVRVRRGLDRLNLGERCKHGCITSRICGDCAQPYA